jgi:hypothetical protein
MSFLDHPASAAKIRPEEIPVTVITKREDLGPWSWEECDKLAFGLENPIAIRDPTNMARLVIVGRYTKPYLARIMNRDGETFDHQKLDRLEPHDPTYHYLFERMVLRCRERAAPNP